MIYSANSCWYSKILGEVHEIARVVNVRRDIWAFACQKSRIAYTYNCKPVKGVIDGMTFYEYKRDGKGLKKNGVGIYSRLFADTYEEAVKGYNGLINARIARLKNEIEELESMLIKEPKSY